MAYLLVENRQIVHLGPIEWKQRFIQSELNDLNISYVVPPVAPGYVKINNLVEIIPITGQHIPHYNPMFEQLVGPNYIYYVDFAHETYLVTDLDFVYMQNNVKQAIATERYKRENAGVTVHMFGTTVTIDTSRGKREPLILKYAVAQEDELIKWKFPEGWFTLTKSELGEMVQASASYIQAQFDWESNICAQIDTAQNKEELQQIATVSLTQ
ncbi:MAG: DUF4376 domain-containing protein [Nitrososphaeraceae archaeon]